MLPILRGKPVLQVIKAMASLGGIPATSQQLMVALVSAPELNRTTIFFSGLLVIQAMAPTKKSPPRMKSVHLVALVSFPESNRTTKKSPPGVFLVVTKESLPACPRQLNP